MRAFARSMRRGNSCQHCANYDEVSARAVKENTERPPQKASAVPPSPMVMLFRVRVVGVMS
jgi:hypothetical protein